MIRDWLRPFSSGTRKSTAKDQVAGGEDDVPGAAARARNRWPAPAGDAASMRSGDVPGEIDGWEKIALELYDADEADDLRDFLAADRLEVHADPNFREQLRRKLWAIVSGDGDDSGE